MKKQNQNNKTYVYDARYNFVMDDDAKAVLSFMQRNIAAEKLVAVSRFVSQIAPCLWSHYPATDVIPMNLQLPPIGS
ncbi:MAG: hypothetical protein NTX44_05795 [Ignavibacteriales bacterium]|nr:hypothetical protein [Ignavibacteriales bacterium]